MVSLSPDGIISMIACSLVMILFIFFIIDLLKNFRYCCILHHISSDSELNINVHIKHLTVVCVFSYFVCAVLNYIAGIYGLITLSERKKVAAFATGFQIIGKVAMQMGFVCRLQFAFKDSIYAYSQTLITSLYILSFIELPLGFSIGYSYFINDENMTYMVAAIFLTYDFYLSLFTVSLFVRKLFQLMYKRVTTGSKESVDIELSADYIDLLTRFSLLVLVTFLTDLTVTVLAAVFNFNELENQFIFNCFTIDVDALINAVCLYMTFGKLSSAIYYKYLCSVCHHGCCQKCCICYISWKLGDAVDVKEVENRLTARKESTKDRPLPIASTTDKVMSTKHKKEATETKPTVQKHNESNI